MSLWMLTLVFLFFCISAQATSNIDLPVYNVKIKSDPIKLSSASGNHFEVVSINGQRFSCFVPNTTKQRVFSSSVTDTTSNDVRSVVNSFNKSSCLEVVHGWWTYKVCINVEVIQYHEEKGTISASSSLGTFAKEYEWSTSETSDPQVRYKYHSQFYDHGSVCDVTGKPRSAEVQFICQFQALTPTIVQVAEVVTCSYVIRIAFVEFCTIPALAPLQEVKPSDIVCSPSLSDESYVRFVDAEKNRLLEERGLQEDLALKSLLPVLPYRRSEMQKKILYSRRSYRKRMAFQSLKNSRKLIKDCKLLIDSFYRNGYPMSSVTLSVPETKNLDLNSPSYKYLDPALLAKFTSILSLDVEGTYSTEKLLTHNETLEIASILIDRARRSFEHLTERGQLPNTRRMLNGLLSIFTRVLSIETVKDLRRVRSALGRYRPKSFPHRSASNPYYDELITLERFTLTSLNTTIELAKSTTSFLYFQSYLSQLIGSAYAQKPSVRVDLKQLFLHEMDDGESLRSAKAFQETFKSPKYRSIMELVSGSPQRRMVYKASFNKLNPGNTILMISEGRSAQADVFHESVTDMIRLFSPKLDEEDGTESSHEENERNYNIKLPSE